VSKIVTNQIILLHKLSALKLILRVYRLFKIVDLNIEFPKKMWYNIYMEKKIKGGLLI
jgi:hypothetical protein